MALVRKIGKVDVAEKKERLVLEGLVPQYEWQTTAGEDRSGLKLHYLSFLPERAEDGRTQPAQLSGFLDSLTDPVTGSVRGGRECVPLRITGAGAVALAARMVGAIALAGGASQEEAKAEMDAFDASEALTIKTGSLFIDMRPEAVAEALRGEDTELVALYATSGGISGRVMYAPPFEYEEGFE